MIHVNLAIGPRDGHRFQQVRAVVNPTNSYTVMPSPLLEMLGVDPQWTDWLEGPEGSRQEFSLAETVVLFDTEGRFLTKWDLAQIYGTRSEPEDIVIDAEGKHIYIAEVFGHRVLHLLSP